MRRPVATAAAVLISATLTGSAEALGQNKTSWSQLPHAPAPKYPATKKCDPTRCICTPQAYIQAFLNTPNLSGNSTTNPNLNSAAMPFPLCVGEHLVGRVNGNSVPPVSSTIQPLGSDYLARRRVVFVFDYRVLETILGLGQFRAKRILELVGFGALPSFSCRSPDRQELVVWSLKDVQAPAGCKRKNPNDPNSPIPNKCNRTPILPAYWDNILPWLEQNYKMDLGHLEPAMQKLKTTRFQVLTGCNPLAMTQLQNPYNGAQLQTVGCSAEFANAVDTLQAGKCYRGTAEQVRNHPKNYLFYSRSTRNAKNNYCDSDTYVQNLGPNDAVKLRAFLYSAQSFTQFFTGYGYTANFFQEPMAAEFFVNNDMYSKVDYANVLLDCSKSSDPFERQGAISATADIGPLHFVPTLAGYPDW